MLLRYLSRLLVSIILGSDVVIEGLGDRRYLGHFLSALNTLGKVLSDPSNRTVIELPHASSRGSNHRMPGVIDLEHLCDARHHVGHDMLYPNHGDQPAPLVVLDDVAVFVLGKTLVKRVHHWGGYASNAVTAQDKGLAGNYCDIDGHFLFHLAEAASLAI